MGKVEESETGLGFLHVSCGKGVMINNTINTESGEKQRHVLKKLS